MLEPVVEHMDGRAEMEFGDAAREVAIGGDEHGRVWQLTREHERFIAGAIEIGAPLYNKGTPEGHEACFRIYEGTATKFEQSGPCAGVKTAFGNGLLTANTKQSYKEKAWAMRDTFDGLLNAAKAWATAPGNNLPQPKKK